jgi:hypothetical protein
VTGDGLVELWGDGERDVLAVMTLDRLACFGGWYIGSTPSSMKRATRRLLEGLLKVTLRREANERRRPGHGWTLPEKEAQVDEDDQQGQPSKVTPTSTASAMRWRHRRRPTRPTPTSRWGRWR